VDFGEDYVAVVGAYYVVEAWAYYVAVVGAYYVVEAGVYYVVVFGEHYVAEVPHYYCGEAEGYDVGLTHRAGQQDYWLVDLCVGFLAGDCAYVVSHQQAVKQEYGLVSFWVVHDLQELDDCRKGCKNVHWAGS